MHRWLTVAILTATLAACVGTPLTTATPAQRLYAADGAYRALLDLAVAYKDACVARPVGQQSSCRPVVESLRAIDARYALLRQTITDGTPTAGDAARVEALVSAMQTTLAGEAVP